MISLQLLLSRPFLSSRGPLLLLFEVEYMSCFHESAPAAGRYGGHHGVSCCYQYTYASLYRARHVVCLLLDASNAIFQIRFPSHFPNNAYTTPSHPLLAIHSKPVIFRPPDQTRHGLDTHSIRGAPPSRATAHSASTVLSSSILVLDVTERS